ncbi:MAG: FkbM family methyltransferase [Gemmatimonadaceae bacterium]|nr:FkbM family methyltransferase [Gemmatimonadaceae bacterium]
MLPNILVESAWRLRHRVLRALWNRGEAEAFQPALELQLARLQVGLVLDVGANRGQYGRLLRRVGYKGHIASFEPVSANVNDLLPRAQNDGNWTVHQMGLGSENGTLTINISKRTEFSSFLSSSSLGRGTFEGEIDTVLQEQVAVRTLDGEFAALRSKHPHGAVHLKLDTQGFDLEILRGSAQTLPNIESLQLELSFIPLYESMPSYREVLEYLTDSGYFLTAFIPVSRDRHLRVIEADCLFRREI